MGNLFVNALAGKCAELADLMALPGGLIEQMGVGADLTKFDVPDGAYAGYVAGSAGDGFCPTPSPSMLQSITRTARLTRLAQRLPGTSETEPQTVAQVPYTPTKRPDFMK